ncbi:unnamed protein product [Ostreobium quekettii]|uniref:Myb-like domain-containing protein n=1 Tax=Ostreobium quekettii TaxID=121088 RepID=A0A8S1ITI3_9CHLO|nr:unnamed protein product [Ostreobium quekettii]
MARPRVKVSQASHAQRDASPSVDAIQPPTPPHIQDAPAARSNADATTNDGRDSRAQSPRPPGGPSRSASSAPVPRLLAAKRRIRQEGASKKGSRKLRAGADLDKGAAKVGRRTADNLPGELLSDEDASSEGPRRGGGAKGVSPAESVELDDGIGGGSHGLEAGGRGRKGTRKAPSRRLVAKKRPLEEQTGKGGKIQSEQRYPTRRKRLKVSLKETNDAETDEGLNGEGAATDEDEELDNSGKDELGRQAGSRKHQTAHTSDKKGPAGSKRRKRQQRKQMKDLLKVQDLGSLCMSDLIRRSQFMEHKKEMKARRDQDEKQKKNGKCKEAPTVQDIQASQQGSRIAPQVQVIDGRIVLNTQSLEVHAQESGLAGYQRVEEGEDRLVNSHTYSNWIKPKRWKKEDSLLLYEGLRQFGTDFTLIGQLFPDRQRKQLKTKFQKEWRANPKKMEAIVAGRSNTEGQQMYKVLLDKLELRRREKETRRGEPTTCDAEEGKQGANDQQAEKTQAEQQRDAASGPARTTAEVPDDDPKHEEAWADDDGYVDEEDYYYM